MFADPANGVKLGVPCGASPADPEDKAAEAIDAGNVVPLSFSSDAECGVADDENASLVLRSCCFKVDKGKESDVEDAVGATVREPLGIVQLILPKLPWDLPIESDAAGTPLGRLPAVNRRMVEETLGAMVKGPCGRVQLMLPTASTGNGILDMRAAVAVAD